jgi:hypothetical protein
LADLLACEKEKVKVKKKVYHFDGTFQTGVKKDKISRPIKLLSLEFKKRSRRSRRREEKKT